MLEYILHSTVRIKGISSKNISTGTGFFFKHEKLNNNSPVLVTNKHVLDGYERIELILTKQDKFGNPSYNDQIVYMINNLSSLRVNHPDPLIDISIIIISGMLVDLSSEDIKVHLKPIDESFLPNEIWTDSLDPVEEVIMIGYPNGLWDEANNLPLTRKGITSSWFKFNFNGRYEFIVDMSCIPGSSGSPVFHYQRKPIFDNMKVISFKKEVKLLGILFAGLSQNELEESHGSSGRYKLSFNLGRVIKFGKLLDFISK